jgi:hypothetical protein
LFNSFLVSLFHSRRTNLLLNFKNIFKNLKPNRVLVEMQVLGASTTEERGGYGRMNSAKDARRTARPNADIASRTPGRVEEPLGCSGTNNL